MAGFCSKCGASLSSSTGFCPSCGTPIAPEAVAPPAIPPAAVPAPQSVPVAAVPPQPGAYAAYQQQKSSGGGALKIILIVIAVIVVLGVGAAGIAGYIAYRAIHAAGTSLSVGKGADVGEADLGVALYPGATHLAAGGMKMKIGNNSVVSSAYSTTDPEAQVVDFYRGKLGENVQVSESGNTTTLVTATVDGGLKDSVVVTVTPQSQGGATRFVIVHTKSEGTS